METDSYIIKYRHLSCTIMPGVEWFDLWSCACNGRCPACGTKDIEPTQWGDASGAFNSPEKEPPLA